MSKLEELRSILLQHHRRYPDMAIEDMIKLIYQNEFAGGHLITDETTSLARLSEETRALRADAPEPAGQTVFEDIGNGLKRLNLWAIADSGIGLHTINRFFVSTANSWRGSISSLEKKLQFFSELCASGKLPYAPSEVAAHLATYRDQGYPAVSHSDVFRNSYHPAYRVVLSAYEEFFQLFCRLDSLLSSGCVVNVAIDGHSGSGKSTLATLIGQVYDCNIFHMDDFFLPPALRTDARLAEPGGNVDYLRFRQEVIVGLHSGRQFAYQPYDCRLAALAEPVSVNPKQLNVIEGSYSMHPTLVDSYQLKVFLEVSPEEQLHRIRQRNGEAMLKRFKREWIPLENRYFRELNIAAQSDLVFRR